uniref:Tudor domain-containing protein n=1 Tax=Timema cristinae TaxID=61476 RepID=A0A7R9GNU8_TIMCR|nr:unnamed protein product [Timema cristinae]
MMEFEFGRIVPQVRLKEQITNCKYMSEGRSLRHFTKLTDCKHFIDDDDDDCEIPNPHHAIIFSEPIGKASAFLLLHESVHDSFIKYVVPGVTGALEILKLYSNHFVASIATKDKDCIAQYEMILELTKEGGKLPYFDNSCVPHVGDIVAAMLPSKGSFHRAMVISVEPDGYMVNFCDQGTIKLVSVVKKLPNKYICLPQAAIKCRVLTYLIPEEQFYLEYYKESTSFLFKDVKFLENKKTCVLMDLKETPLCEIAMIPWETRPEVKLGLGKLPEKGDLVACQYLVDMNYYRARVFSIKDKVISVFFVDYGNMDTNITLEMVKPLSEEFKTFPFMAFKFNMAYGSDYKVMPRLVSYIDTLVNNKVPLVLEFHPNGVVLKTEDGVSVNEQIKRLSESEPSVKELNLAELAKTFQPPSSDGTLKAASSVNTSSQLTSVVSGRADKEQLNIIAKMLKELKEFYDSAPQHPHTPVVEELCIAKFGAIRDSELEINKESNTDSIVDNVTNNDSSSEEDGIELARGSDWHRAVCLFNNHNSGKHNLLFLELGCVQEVSSDNIRKMVRNPKVLRIPSLAFMCKLQASHLVSPSNNRLKSELNKERGVTEIVSTAVAVKETGRLRNFLVNDDYIKWMQEWEIIATEGEVCAALYCKEVIADFFGKEYIPVLLPLKRKREQSMEDSVPFSNSIRDRSVLPSSSKNE